MAPALSGGPIVLARSEITITAKQGGQAIINTSLLLYPMQTHFSRLHGWQLRSGRWDRSCSLPVMISGTDPHIKP